MMNSEATPRKRAMPGYRRVLAVLTLAVATGLIAGCGPSSSGNGNNSPSPSQSQSSYPGY